SSSSPRRRDPAPHHRDRLAVLPRHPAPVLGWLDGAGHHLEHRQRIEGLHVDGGDVGPSSDRPTFIRRTHDVGPADRRDAQAREDPLAELRHDGHLAWARLRQHEPTVRHDHPAVVVARERLLAAIHADHAAVVEEPTEAGEDRARGLPTRNDRSDRANAGEDSAKPILDLALLDRPLKSADESEPGARHSRRHPLLVLQLALEVFGECLLSASGSIHLALADACDLPLELFLASLAPLVELLPRVAQTIDLALLLGDLSLRGDASDLNLIVCALRAHQADLELPGLLGCGKLVFDLPNVAGELFPPRLDPP